jgi:hypothetical protein
MKRVVNFQVGSFYPLISDHCPITVKIFSEYNHSTPQEILRPKPFNLKWTKIVEEQFISNLNNIDLNSISDKIVSFKQKSLDTSRETYLIVGTNYSHALILLYTRRHATIC